MEIDGENWTQDIGGQPNPAGSFCQFFFFRFQKRIRVRLLWFTRIQKDCYLTSVQKSKLNRFRNKDYQKLSPAGLNSTIRDVCSQNCKIKYCQIDSKTDLCCLPSCISVTRQTLFDLTIEMIYTLSGNTDTKHAKKKISVFAASMSDDQIQNGENL